MDEAIHDYDAFVLSKGKKLGEERQGTWRKWFGREGFLYVELGTGKGDFIRQMAERCPEINFIGIEAEQDVLYSAAKKVAEGELTNVRLLAGLTVRDISFNLHGENREDNIMTEYERKFSGLGEKINRCEAVFP